METRESTANVDDFKWWHLKFGGCYVEHLPAHLECFVILNRVFTATSHMETDSDDFEFEIVGTCEERTSVINVDAEFC